MIGLLRGHIVKRQPTRLILDVQGVGYEVAVPISTYEALGEAGGEVSLHTHLHVREDALQLYGFASEAEKALFLTLIAISGIGPKVALGILSSCRVDEFTRLIRNGDVGRLKALPGIGKKTAERLVLELRDRLGAGAGGVAEMPPAQADSFEQAELALVSLGYNRANVQKVLAALLQNGASADVEALIKQALRQM